MATPQDASQATTRGEAVNDFVRSPQVHRWHEITAFEQFKAASSSRVSTCSWRSVELLIGC